MVIQTIEEAKKRVMTEKEHNHLYVMGPATKDPKALKMAANLMEAEFDLHTHCRTTDPDTSREAAEAMVSSGRLAKQADRVWRSFSNLFGIYPPGLTTKELSDLSAIPYEICRRRFSDLKNAGLIHQTKYRRDRRIVWATGPGEAPKPKPYNLKTEAEEFSRHITAHRVLLKKLMGDIFEWWEKVWQNYHHMGFPKPAFVTTAEQIKESING